MRSSKTRCLGILTAGGDSPGLNAVVRAITKVAMNEYGIRVLGIQDGFRGLVENRMLVLDDATVSGVLTRGGTILGTSRDKPHAMPIGGRLMDMTDAAVENARKHQIDCLVCLGGGGTAKNAYRLWQRGGVNVMTLPKTIDNDVYGTDVSFGFDTAVTIATEAIDRLHTTATSHHRLIVVRGHGPPGRLAGAPVGHRRGRRRDPHPGTALQPGEGRRVPAGTQKARQALLHHRRGRRGPHPPGGPGGRRGQNQRQGQRQGQGPQEGQGHGPPGAGEAVNGAGGEEEAVDAIRADLPLRVRRLHDETMAYHVVQEPMSSRLARHLQALTGVEARVTTLGHVQRGGVPTAFDRTLSTLLGAKAAELLGEGTYNVMVAYRNGMCVPVALGEVVGKRKLVPADHPLIHSARQVGSCFGD